MPSFEFVAIQAKEEVRGTVKAPDLLSARRHLLDQYERVLAVEPVREEKEEFLPMPWRRVGVDILATYTRQFATLLNAGVSMYRSIVVLEQGESPRLNRVLARVRKDILGGMPLSAALGRHPTVFPGDYVSLVRAGETGGTLASTLARVATGLEKAAAFRQRLLASLTYPASVLALAMAVLWLFLYWVMPAMQPIFDNLGVEMPTLTRLVVGLTVVLRNPFLVGGGLVVLLTAASFGWNFLFKTPRGRLMWWRSLHSVPLVGDAMRKLAISRFLYALAAMLGSGVKFDRALQAVEDISPDPMLQESIRNVRHRIRTGIRLADAVRAEEIFPGMVTQMILAGEDSGQMAEMMRRTAEAYDMEVDLFMSGMLALMEPLVLVILGVVASVVLLAAFMPILQLMSAF